MQDAGTKLEQGSAQLRCIGCGSVLQSAGRNFRCPDCDDLLEVTYPGWKCADTALRPQDLKASWTERRKSSAYADQRGVWREPGILPVAPAPATRGSPSGGKTPGFRGATLDRHHRGPALFVHPQGAKTPRALEDT